MKENDNNLEARGVSLTKKQWDRCDRLAEEYGKKSRNAFIKEAVDFYCAWAKIVIELDGGGHYTAEQVEKDAIRTKALESMNLTVLRICNLEIDRNFTGVCEAIDLTVKNLSLSQLR